MKINEKYLLILILVIGGGLRIWQLSSVPAGLNLDEASIGYNAYSIGLEGIDEHGHRFPLFFEAFGEYKNPIFIYSLVPFVKLFGLSVGIIRVVAALYGIGTIFLLYLVGSRLFSKKVGLLSAFFLAVSPWHMLFSRMSLEVITLPFFFLLGLYFLLGKKPTDYAWSAVAFGISLYTYAAAKLFVPLFLVFYGIIYRDEVFHEFFQKYWKALLIFFLFAAPLYYLSFFGHANERFSQVSVFSTEKPGLIFVSNYLSYYSPQFLFFSGDTNIRNSVEGYGQFLSLTLVFFLLGLYWLFSSFKDKRAQLLFCWLLIYPIPAALTTGPMPNALRGMTSVGVFSLIMAQGIIVPFSLKKVQTSRIALLGIVLALLFVWQVFHFESAYFRDYPKEVAHKQQYGITEAINYAKSIRTNQTIIISNEIKQPYIYILFDSKIPASQYVKEGLPGIEVCKLEECVSQEAIYVVTPIEIANFQPDHEIMNPAGVPAYKIYSTENIREQKKEALCKEQCTQDCEEKGGSYATSSFEDRCVCRCKR